MQPQPEAPAEVIVAEVVEQAEAEKEEWEEGVPPEGAEAEVLKQWSPQAPLPLGDDSFPDEVLAIVCCWLGLCELGRLACVSRRFTARTLAEPDAEGTRALLSPIEEGARLRLAAAVEANGGGTVTRNGWPTWLRALWCAEFRLAFTSCGPGVVLSEEGASSLAGCDAAHCRCLQSLVAATSEYFPGRCR